MTTDVATRTETDVTVPNAAVIADSVSPAGVRLTTIEVTLHRFVLAELNTHRVFSRNSASSRAIPVAKQLARVVNDPALPVEFGANQPHPVVRRDLERGVRTVLVLLGWSYRLELVQLLVVQSAGAAAKGQTSGWQDLDRFLA